MTPRERIDALLGELAHAERTEAEERAALAESRRDSRAAVRAAEVAQSAAAAVQRSAHRRLASVATRCLRAAGFDYDFEVEFVRKRGKTEARCWLVKDGVRHRPRSMAGGGAVDVASFGLRVAAVVLSGLRRFLCLDEPFRNVQGRKHRNRLPAMLEAMVDDLGFQFVVVANELADLDVGAVIQLTQ